MACDGTLEGADNDTCSSRLCVWQCTLGVTTDTFVFNARSKHMKLSICGARARLSFSRVSSIFGQFYRCNVCATVCAV